MDLENSVKWKIGWGFTAACNMHCPFCYSDIARTAGYENDLTAALRFVDDNISLIDSINYGTGECALSEAWFELIAYIRKNYSAVRQALTTNGSIAAVTQTDAHKRKIWLDAIDEVDISLDFIDADKHNETRGSANAFRWANETLEVCSSEGIVPTLVFVGYEDTLAEDNLAGLFELAAKYNAFVRMNILRPTPGTHIPPPSYDRLVSALHWIFDTQQIVSLCDPLIGALYDSASAQPDSTGISSMRILPDGSVTPSTYLITKEWRNANIKEGINLSDLHQFATFQKLITAPVPTECQSCRVVGTCRGGAFDRRILHFKSLEARDPYCPDLNRHPLPESVPLTHYQSIHEVPSVHDGYLPTLVFAPQ